MIKDKIPVYEVFVPEYRFSKAESLDAADIFKYAATPDFTLEIPRFYVERAPDFDAIGKKIDSCLVEHFKGQSVAVRAISSEEHDEKTREELVDIIRDSGWDRYDFGRVGDRYDNVEGKRIDLFALDFEITSEGEYFSKLAEPFYFWPVADGREPIRLDVVILYDLAKLDVVEHKYEGRESELKKDGFVFKDPENKNDAVLGIILIN